MRSSFIYLKPVKLLFENLNEYNYHKTRKNITQTSKDVPLTYFLLYIKINSGFKKYDY